MLFLHPLNGYHHHTAIKRTTSLIPIVNLSRWDGVISGMVKPRLQCLKYIAKKYNNYHYLTMHSIYFLLGYKLLEGKKWLTERNQSEIDLIAGGYLPHWI